MFQYIRTVLLIIQFQEVEEILAKYLVVKVLPGGLGWPPLVAGNPILLVLTRTAYLCDFSLCILYLVVSD